jgi:hypothetical protein
MPIHGYPGGVITANPVAPTASVATGVWTTEQQLQAVSQGNWPGYEYPISRSLRFNSADSAYLNRTPASSSNRETWTWSGWVKRTIVNTTGQNLFSTDNGSSTTLGQLFFNDNVFEFNCYASSAYQWRLITTQVWRDLSAWYHIVAVLDTTQATSSNRVKLYVNGVQITAFSTATYPSQGFDGAYNLNQPHYVGAAITSSGYLNGYLTEVNFIDGQALTPSSFGLNDPETGVWSPKRYTGTYGTNGFYLNFSDNSGTTSTTLGKDYSGNGNNWTPNNFSVTAGAGNDSMVDSPTSYGTDTGVGGEVRGNYATLNPLSLVSPTTLANGNLDCVTGTTGGGGAYGTIAFPSSGKFYFEYVLTATSGTLSDNGRVGIAASSSVAVLYQSDGNKKVDGSQTAYGASWTTNDVIGVAVDIDNGSVTFYKNNSSQGAISYTISTKTMFPYTEDGSGTISISSSWNFGQRAFAYTAPSGFKALCTQNLPTPTIGATSTTQANDYMNVVLYTGNRATNTITGVGFQPDFVWLKSRSVATTNHALFDAVRGVGYNLRSNTTDAETIPSPNNALTAFTSDGFTLGANDTAGAPDINYTIGGTYVAWNWKANGAGSSNTAGTITSTVSANTTSGFSIVTYSGAGTTSSTIGHGLGVAPSMFIIKCRNNFTGATIWPVYHASVGNTAYLDLSSTNAASTLTAGWNNTSPTSTVFTVGSAAGVNGSGNTFVAYCFAPVAGYSAFGSYTGNGSTDGPFVYLGFRPAFVLWKRSDGAESWWINDIDRLGYNGANRALFPNLSNAENTANNIDILSNGFKIRGSGGEVNASGGTYIYACFAENPFKFSLAR